MQKAPERDRRWMRTVILALLLLAGGAVVNVAVAWGVMIYDARSAAPRPAPVGPETQRRILRELFDGADDETLEWSTGTGEFFSSKSKGVHRRGAIYGSGIGQLRATIDAGWPCYCLRSSDAWSTTGGGLKRECAWVLTTRNWEDIALPLCPIRLGFIINTLFYVLLLWLLFFAPFAARRMLRRRRGLCEMCAYPVGASPVCTECGAAVRTSVARSS